MTELSRQALPSRKRRWPQLIVALAIVAALAGSKLFQEPARMHLQPPGVEIRTPTPRQYTPRLALEADQLKLNDHSIWLSPPITNSQYQQFVRATKYETWRERNHCSPTWKYADGGQEVDSPPSWLEQPDAPVLWLVKDDADAFCEWLSRQSDEQVVHRLPTVQELEASSHQDNDVWEWTSDKLSTLNSSLPNASDYLTAWKPQTALRHRRQHDAGLNNQDPITFRVTWASQEN